MTEPEQRTSPVTLDYATEHRPARWRTPAALALAAAGGLSAGYALCFTGFGFFPVTNAAVVADRDA